MGGEGHFEWRKKEVLTYQEKEVSISVEGRVEILSLSGRSRKFGQKGGDGNEQMKRETERGRWRREVDTWRCMMSCYWENNI